MFRKKHPVDKANEMADLAQSIYDVCDAHRRAGVEIDRAVRHARRQGMALQDLADLVGVTRQTMAAWLADETKVIVPTTRGST